MVRLMLCPRCSGSGHVRKCGRWVKCACLRLQELINAMDGANVPQQLWRKRNLESVGLVNGAKQKVKRSLFRIPLGQLVLSSGTLEQRWVAAALALKNASLLGRTIYSVGVMDVVNSEFEDRSEGRKAKRVDSLWLRADTSRNHSWETPILQEVLQSRIGKDTIITVKRKLELPVAAHHVVL